MSNVNNRYIEDEMKESYLDYSMSVIVSRALPDVRDGMKPVHRRILFAMSELGMTYDKAYKKSARIVGEVLGKYHPHGDSAVYGTMVRMAQDFNYRYLLVDGHGNFGSIDGDSAAAMRYTEARMAKISNELIDDIDKNTIDFRKNFDDSLDEPTVLPAKLPNLLLNGATGIAVGMATNIPPHNLGELVDGILALIENPELTPLDLMEYIKGPDFPTGGIIDGQKGIRDAYMTGRGKVRVRGKVEIEEHKSGKASIIIKEIPYQLNKATLIERIADLVKDKRVTGITDLRDESDRHGIRVVIEVKKGEEPELILNKLYKYTELQNTFGIIMLALVNNAPRVLNLKEILHEYLKHRFEVVTRRTKFDLDKAEKRAHILQGYKIALDNIDRIIEIIRGSSDGNQARELLIEKYAFSDVQARAILDMKLQRLTGLERGKIDAEHAEIEKYIAELREILSHDSKIYEIIKEELLYLKEKYNDNRRTLIENERMEILPEDLIKDENVILTLTNKGYVKRMEVSKYKAQKRGGKGVASQNTIEDDFVESIESASNLDTLMIFTNQGRVFNIKVYEIPETSKQSRGKLMSNIIRTREDEKIRAVIKTRDFSKDNEVVFVTKEGLIKKTNLDEFKNINNSGLKAIKLKEDDDIIYVGLIEKIDQEQVFIATKQGYSIRFNSDNVRPTGRDTMGVKSITLRPGDSIVSALLIKDEGGSILTVTENGYGKRTRIDEYPLQARSGKGVINIRCNAKTGAVVSVLPVTEGEELMAITSSGIVIRMPLDTIALYGRATQGVIIMKVDGAEKVVSITRVQSEEEEDETSESSSVETEDNIEEAEIVETKED
ncbi:DNA gyrase subunit A [uncultured Fusobacterium sp.]|uniref:DNA gyrase subunit A n=1 Tax=uncultured Fusobacterium sp. TaxID=159267 RepID=UPI000BBAA4F9|nr:DNA gyrase subunit A [uncultured Fusobacterium sp.]BBA49661.1 DNA gyrase subunit A [Fusobacterium varium]